MRPGAPPAAIEQALLQGWRKDGFVHPFWVEQAACVAEVPLVDASITLEDHLVRGVE